MTCGGSKHGWKIQLNHDFIMRADMDNEKINEKRALNIIVQSDIFSLCFVFS